MEILSQDEIDRLLTAIDSEPLSAEESVAGFGKFLSSRMDEMEKPYGIFDADVTMCRFFGTPGSDELLADIERKNGEQGLDNHKIPGTETTLAFTARPARRVFCPPW